MSPGFARVNLVVEGQTEEAFVRDVLLEFLAGYGVVVVPRLVRTGRKRGRDYRGGLVSYGKARGDITRWMAEDRTAFFSTMFDLYGLPDDFPRTVEARGRADPYEKVRELETGLAEDIADQRFIPYLQLHEFEALLFSDTNVMHGTLSPLTGAIDANRLREIRNGVATPEHIDDGDETAPSKRIFRLYRAYDKPAFGPMIAKRIGMDRLRAECKHFREWVERLQALAL